LKKGNLRASQTPNGANANNDSVDRQLKLKQLYITSFTTLQNAAFEKFPDLTALDAHSAMEAVFGRLTEYGGPLHDSASFEKWGKRKAVEEASRFVFLALANGEYKKMILKVIIENMWESAMDSAVEPYDLFNEVLMLIFDRAPMFLKNKRAKLSTRMCSLARRHVFFHNSRNKKRLAAVTLRIEKGRELGVETKLPQQKDDGPELVTGRA
jgi:hypothetical protein